MNNIPESDEETKRKIKEVMQKVIPEMTRHLPINHTKQQKNIDYDAMASELFNYISHIGKISQECGGDELKTAKRVFLETKPFKEGLKGLKKQQRQINEFSKDPFFKGTQIDDYCKLMDKLAVDLRANKQTTKIFQSDIAIVSLLLSYKKDKSIDLAMDYRSKDMKVKFDVIKNWNVIYENSLIQIIYCLNAAYGKKEISIAQLKKTRLEDLLKLVIKEFPEYSLITTKFDRLLRNTLAHSYPQVDYLSKSITYKKKTLSFAELKVYTRELIALNMTLISLQGRFISASITEMERVAKQPVR